jgi:hypothetical protein
MRDKHGRFKKGERSSQATEFKPGQHWREPKPYWDRDWLYNEYVVKQRSASEIAGDFECKENNILHFLHKHQIPIRTMKEIRAIKYWDVSGPENGMYGRTGENNPNWKGGITPERQALYASLEWANAVKAVWARDQATCRRCKQPHHAHILFHIHHLISFEAVELRTETTNLVLLCKKCHSFVHSKGNINREFIRD